ncbi:hypothetical protein THAOC_32096, partial [Thalassiosira oceanica]
MHSTAPGLDQGVTVLFGSRSCEAARAPINLYKDPSGVASDTAIAQTHATKSQNNGVTMDRDLVGRLERKIEQEVNGRIEQEVRPLVDRIAALEDEIEHLKAGMRRPGGKVSAGKLSVDNTSKAPSRHDTATPALVGRGLSPKPCRGAGPDQSDHQVAFDSEVDGALVKDLAKAMIHSAFDGFDSGTVIDQICRLIRTGSSATRSRKSSHSPAFKLCVEQFLAKNETSIGVPRAALLGALRLLAERNGGYFGEVRELQTMLDSKAVGAAIIEFNHSRKRPSSRSPDEEPPKSHGDDQAKEMDELGKDKDQDAEFRAGISASCGLSTFRGEGGLYDKIDSDKKLKRSLGISSRKKADGTFFTRENFEKDPYTFILVGIPEEILRVYTTNCDGLELAAGVGSESVIQVHGTMGRGYCINCGNVTRDDTSSKVIQREEIAKSLKEFKAPMCHHFDSNGIFHGQEPKGRGTSRCTGESSCPGRSVLFLKKSQIHQGYIRPDVVLFGEFSTPVLDSDYKNADAVVVMGTSLSVRPMSYEPLNFPSNIILINQEKTTDNMAGLVIGQNSFWEK